MLLPGDHLEPCCSFRHYGGRSTADSWSSSEGSTIRVLLQLWRRLEYTTRVNHSNTRIGTRIYGPGVPGNIVASSSMIPLCRRSAGGATSFSHTATDALPQRVRALNNEDRFANGDWLTIHRSHAVQIHLRVPCSWRPLCYGHDLCSRIDYVALSHFYASGIHHSLILQALASSKCACTARPFMCIPS